MNAKWIGIWAMLAAGPLAAGTFVTGTFVYVGTALNYNGTLLGSEDNVVVQAVSTNGTILAESEVFDLTSCGMNFRLAVPLSSQPTNVCAMPGETLNCVVKRDGLTYVVAGGGSFPAVGNANSATNCSLVLATDSDGDGVPDAYVDEMRSYLDYYGIGRYDAAADYDGDGSSNYAEYFAGTNPFDATDYLHAKAVCSTDAADTNGLFTISFEYVGGHIYAVDSATNLVGAAWARRGFRLDPSSPAEKKRVMPASGEVGTQTLYFVPAAKAEFFKLLVNPQDAGDCE